VTFSETHTSTFADVDGDGIPDFIVGKRLFAHEESYTDPDPMGPPVLSWFRTVRNPKAPGGAEFVPELIHNQFGSGIDGGSDCCQPFKVLYRCMIDRFHCPTLGGLKPSPLGDGFSTRAAVEC